MLISTKLSLVFSAASVVLFGGYGVHLVRTENADLRSSTEREVQALGSSVEVAVENALRDGQMGDVSESVHNLAVIDRRVALLVYDGDGRRQIDAEDGPMLPAADELAQSAIRAREAVLRYLPDDHPAWLVHARPLVSDDGAAMGALVLARNLAEMERDLADTARGIWLTIALFVCTAWFLTFVVSHAWLRHPLGRLVEAMRALRTGDLMAELKTNGNDEIAAVAAEFNATVRDLRSARQRLDAEAAARRQLEQGLRDVDKLASVGQLAAGVAHEIGSPLQVLQGRAALIAQRPGDPDQVRRNAEILVTQTERIARIIEQLLAFSRRRGQRLVHVDLRSVAREILNLLELEASRLGISLVLVADELPTLETDPDRMQQLVFNLVRNALQATPRGGTVTVVLRADTMDDQGGAPAVALAIHDTGRGIPAELRGRIFEPFFTTRAQDGGTGLGLAVVRSIIDAHWGRIAVEDAPGGGTVVRILLPSAMVREAVA